MLHKFLLAALLVFAGTQAFAHDMTPPAAEPGNYTMLLAGIGLIAAIASRRSNR
jgi:hypothetical protein